MKKRIFFTIVGCICLLNFSCSSSERVHDTYYTYINNTSSAITIECYYGDAWGDEVVNPDELYKTITIPSGESNTVHLTSDTFCMPFLWLNSPDVYLLVHNGQIKVFDDGSADDSLLMLETYTLTSESETVRHYEYVFTDDYFKDGEPIE
ncbi:hypothetical protein [Alistipes putredinis]|uniref:hypothetical protein n=1 Tax=Alistipes putredinis TaxID=28117 RepID=UPI003AB03639